MTMRCFCLCFVCLSPASTARRKRRVHVPSPATNLTLAVCGICVKRYSPVFRERELRDNCSFVTKCCPRKCVQQRKSLEGKRIYCRHVRCLVQSTPSGTSALGQRSVCSDSINPFVSPADFMQPPMEEVKIACFTVCKDDSPSPLRT
jgi:hypothetical protein